MLHWVPRYSVRRFRFTIPNGAFVAHLARLAYPPSEGGNGWQGWASGMSNGGPQKDAPANRGCRGIGVELLADGQLIQIVDDRTATFRFGYFRCLFLAAGRPLWGWAILLKAVTAIEVGMLYALIAATHRTGPRVPLPRARALTGICLSGDAMGRRTGARGVDGPGAVGLTGRSTVGATGIAWRRSIGWSRAVGWRRGLGWRSRRAILCIRRLHPNGRSHNAHASEGDQSAFHRYLPLI